MHLLDVDVHDCCLVLSLEERIISLVQTYGIS